MDLTVPTILVPLTRPVWMPLDNIVPIMPVSHLLLQLSQVVLDTHHLPLILVSKILMLLDVKLDLTVTLPPTLG
jgi:hypothetical protein